MTMVIKLYYFKFDNERKDYYESLHCDIYIAKLLILIQTVNKFYRIKFQNWISLNITKNSIGTKCNIESNNRSEVNYII